jgi:glycosyltransferase involved in cell wall biosynthesis
MHPPRLTLAICTHNRPHLLRQLVKRLAPEMAAYGIPLLVVDSASAAPAAAAVARCVAEHSVARLIRLDAPGVSAARNAALAATRTPWLAFIDDDEMPADGWAVNALALIARLPEACGACGGEVAPSWPEHHPTPQPGPRWLAYLSLIHQPGEFDQSAAPHFGVGHSLLNVSAVRSVGGFDTRLGRDGATLLSGEESLLVEALVARKWQVWHSDRILVHHLIEPERLDPAWARSRAYWEGVSRARLLAIIDQPGLHRLYRDTMLKAPALRLLAKVMPPAKEFDLRLAFVEGVLAEQRSATIVRRESPRSDISVLEAAPMHQDHPALS